MTGQGIAITSASGIVALLNEPERELKEFALRKLDEIVDNFWAEIADVLQRLEELSEDGSFPQRELASLVVSKVYYHLGSFSDSITFALAAGDRFEVNSTSEYVQTIISKCIDMYAQLKTKHFEGSAEEKDVIDERLEGVVNRMFQWCLLDKEYKQAVGIALETRRMDILKRAIVESGCEADMLSYTLRIVLTHVESRRLRDTVLKLLVALYMNLESPDYINVAQCFIFLDEPQSMADVLLKLAKGSESDVLTGYQIAFDVYEGATQHFVRQIQISFSSLLPQTSKPKVAMETSEPSKDKVEEEMETDQTTEDNPAVESKPTETKPIPVAESEPEPEPEWVAKLKSIQSILSGELTISTNQDFLIRNNHTDLQILKNIKDASRSAVCHNGTVIANGFMHFGTTSDTFLRENLDWLKKATHWAKFTATASLGVVHKGHEKEALNLMSAYLPKDSSGTGQYAEGGGLYALGLIHANHGQGIMEYLMKEIRVHTEEVVRHGGCLGLGLAAMGTASTSAYDLLKDCLNQDDAVVGEASGIGMGLVMVGTGSVQALEDMISYSRETQHEKIQRGLALGISMVMYGRLEDANPWIDELLHDKDPLLRRAGVFMTATAYCGTEATLAVRQLLHVGVTDVDDDVRRAAIMSIGFILFRTPEQCPAMVSLLLESYNPHVRQGAVMALGIACAGTGNKEALSMIEPLCSDNTNFVRQGALIASSLILIQQTEVMNPKVASFKERFAKTASDKHETSLTKLGAILGQGIVNAGGKNVTISLQSRAGHTNMAAMIGLLVFTQFWYWYPLSHFLSLSFVPTSLIALNQDLKMPKMQFISRAKPSLFGYPPAIEKEKKEEKTKVAKAVLSVTEKAKARAHKKEIEKMEVEAGTVNKASTPVPQGDAPADKPAQDEPEGNKPEKEVKDDKKVVEVEPDFSILSNPTRVLPQQWKYIELMENSGYEPVKKVSAGGIIMFSKKKEDQEEELVEPLKANVPGQDEEEEPPPPEPFEWDED